MTALKAIQILADAVQEAGHDLMLGVEVDRLRKPATFIDLSALSLGTIFISSFEA